MKTLVSILVAILLTSWDGSAQTTCKPLAAPMTAPANYSTTYKRPFYMGFTGFPHSASTECGDPLETNLYYNTNFGDVMTIHEDGRIPWAAAIRRWFEPGLTSWPTQYPMQYQQEIYLNAIRRNRLPASHKVVLYLNYMNFHKTALADDRSQDPVTGATVTTPLPKEKRYQFNNDYYVFAFIAHAMYLIEAYRPDYVGFGTENNLILTNIVDTAYSPDPNDDIPYQAWIDYVEATKRIYSYLKYYYPKKLFYISLQIDEYNLHKTWDMGANLPLYNTLLKAINYTQSPHFYTRYLDSQVWHRENLKKIMPANDVIAVSTYPYMSVGTNVQAIPTDHFSKIRELDPSKPFAVAETGYIGEPLVFPDPMNGQQVTIDGNNLAQAQYVGKLVTEGTNQKALFINWYIARDYDHMWNQVLVNDLENRNINRIWRDIGIFDGEGSVRLSGLVWQIALWRGVQQ